MFVRRSGKRAYILLPVRRLSLSLGLLGVVATLAACRDDHATVARNATPAVTTPAQPAPAVAAVRRVRHRVAVAAEEAAGMIEDKLDVTRREVKDRFANQLAALLRSADNRADYWTVVMDSQPAGVDRSAYYDAQLRLTSGGDCRFSPGDSVATYECDVHDPAPFSDLNGKLAAYADASRGVIPASWIQAGEDGAFHAVNPFCRAEEIRIVAGDSLRVMVTLPYGQPCALPYNASTSKS
jgi:hypothetical protein